jgi:hypothetical protein
VIGVQRGKTRSDNEMHTYFRRGGWMVYMPMMQMQRRHIYLLLLSVAVKMFVFTCMY